MNRNLKVHSFLLVFWITTGLILRLIHLGSKPIWSDEFATLVFSLGHGFRGIPLDQLIELETLLTPLRLDSGIHLRAVSEHLFTESNHPPVYFMLTHLWVKLFSNSGEFVSIWGARSLSTILGTVSIPMMFGLGWIGFYSLTVGQFAAALMAVSPFGVYLAQEARHYTLAMLLIMASLMCLMIALREVQQQKSLPSWFVLLWIGINTLGIAVHFFFGVVLGAIGLVTLWFWLLKLPRSPAWLGICQAAVGSMIGGLIWLPILFKISSSDDGLISWIFYGEPSQDFIEPLLRIFVWIVTMVVIFPVENQSLGLTLFSATGMLSLFGIGIYLIVQGQKYIPHFWDLPRQILIGTLLSILVIFLITTYGFRIDLTLASRYQFTYFPVVISLFSVYLSLVWQSPKNPQHLRKLVGLILIAGLFSSLMVINNLAYQKPDRSDLVAGAIAPTLSVTTPSLIATVYKNHEQIGEMMGIAWELKQLEPTRNQPQFLLAQKSGDPSIPVRTLNQVLSTISRPLNLWTVNFSAPQELEGQNCFQDEGSKSRVSGYYFRMYQCLPDN
ncbi:MAG: hypothetical protein HC825_03935 [Oscillatoriales cyanobacterium RM1_1_9]|nr:hypothetical protein [Oscillatoriales cyanobacterium RM1_1_9]